MTRQITLLQQFAAYFKSELRWVDRFSFHDTGKEDAEKRREIAQREKNTSRMLKDASEQPVHLKDSDLLHIIQKSIEWDDFKYRNHEFFLFGDCIFAVKGPCTIREFQLIVCEEADKERRYFDHLSSRLDTKEIKDTFHIRERIPDRIRNAVWRRDGGKCARCSSRERLEYDHIIPVVEGGNNTTRNIELLCEKCNRSKGKQIQ